MLGISPLVMVHKLNVDPNFKPVQQGEGHIRRIKAK